MNRREFLNFLSKGIAISAITPIFSKANTVTLIDRDQIKGISPSSLDEVVLADGLQYQLLISWNDKINKKNLDLTMII